MDINENEDQLQEIEPLSSDPQPVTEPEQEQPDEDRSLDPVVEVDLDDEKGSEGQSSGLAVNSDEPQEILEDLPAMEPVAEEEEEEDGVLAEDFLEDEEMDLVDDLVDEIEEEELPVPAADKSGAKKKAADPYASVTVAEEPAADDGRAWYVIHCYSGNEDKVRHNILQRIESMSMDNLIFDVVVPTEDEVNIKNGERQTVEKKVFPGYILVYMILTEESWYMVRNTPGVTGFVGMGNDPTALQPEEVARILKRMESESPRINVTFRPGERVRIVDGPFEDFYGKVAEIDMDRATVRVMVNFFGRETPVELDFLQVEEA